MISIESARALTLCTGVELLAVSNETSLKEGGTALLVCVGYGGLNYTEIFWTRNGVALTNTSLTSIHHEEVIQGRRTFILSVLQMCSVGLADAGSYTCVISNGEISATALLKLAVIGEEKHHTIQLLELMAVFCRCGPASCLKRCITDRGRHSFVSMYWIWGPSYCEHFLDS